jgi:hypothetical protein
MGKNKKNDNKNKTKNSKKNKNKQDESKKESQDDKVRIQYGKFTINNSVIYRFALYL